MLEGWQFPDVTVYLVGILGLLVVWQYYQMQIMAGRILECIHRPKLRRKTFHLSMGNADDQLPVLGC